jgi:cell wall-associated NlpC family hydrolase
MAKPFTIITYLPLFCFLLLSCAALPKHKGKTEQHYHGKNEWSGIASDFRHPAELEKRIEEFLGSPYLLGGESKDGLDCSALAKLAYEVYEIDLPRSAILQSKLGIEIPKHALLPGDLVFFGETQSDSVTHVGIDMGNNKFANATSSQGVKYSDLHEPFFFSKYLFAKRLKTLP